MRSLQAAVTVPGMGNRRVLIAGGGVGAVEAALALRALAGTRVSIELISPYDELVYRPLAVAEPFGDSPAPRLAFARLRRTHSVEHVRDIVDAVDVRGRRVRLEDRGWLPFDDLVIAIGARTRGWLTGSLVFRGAADVCAYRHLLDRVAGGEVRSLVFAAPEGASWPLPLYELALLTAGWIADRHVADMDLHLVTG